MPVLRADVASIVARDTATIGNDAKNDEANDCDDFDHAKDEFN